MRYFTFLLLIFGVWSVNLSCAQDTDEILIWGERDLEWKDFSGPIEQNSTHEASTRGQLKAPNSWNSDSLTIVITAEFVKSKSWVKGTPSSSLLKHEQLHFDITEYHARLFRKTMAAYRFKSFETVAEEVTALFNTRFELYKTMQKQYDEETNHSKNLEKQVVWNEKIAGFLMDSSNSKSHMMTIYIGYLK